MRSITELIWHCTATPAGREVTVAEIESWHKARGFKRIGYHKVVHLDGTVSEGRPESMVGAHVEGHNTGTIGYAYIGGIDANDKKKARDTRTPAQKRTMERLTKEAIARYGLKKVSGHHDYANKACPCFNARAEYAPMLRGLMGAGEKDRAGLARSRTVQGSAVAAAGGAGFATDAALEITSKVQEADYHISAGTVFGLVVGVVILGAALYALYARWDDAGRPLPWRRT